MKGLPESILYVFSHTFSTYYFSNAFYEGISVCLSMFLFSFCVILLYLLLSLSRNGFPTAFFTFVQLILLFRSASRWKEEESTCFVFYLCHSSSSRPTVSQSSRCLWVIRTTCQLVHSHLSHSDRCGVLDTVRPLQCVCGCAHRMSKT